MNTYKNFLRGLVNVYNSRVGPLFIIAIIVLEFSQTAYAEGSVGASAIDDATNQLNGYDIAVKKLLYAIAAIISLVGAFNVYFKMQNGDQDVKKTIMLTLGGCVALVALAQALPKFFS